MTHATPSTMSLALGLRPGTRGAERTPRIRRGHRQLGERVPLEIPQGRSGVGVARVDDEEPEPILRVLGVPDRGARLLDGVPLPGGGEDCVDPREFVPG